MPSQSDSPTAAEARDLLTSAQLAGARGDAIAGRSRGAGIAYSTALGILVAAFLLAAVYIFPTRNALLITLATVGYGVGIGVAVLFFARSRRANTRGWARRYLVGFGITMLLYVVGVGLSVSEGPLGISLSTAFWVVYAVATALPVIVASLVRNR